jgi:hypothetical protein
MRIKAAIKNTMDIKSMKDGNLTCHETSSNNDTKQQHNKKIKVGKFYEEQVHNDSSNLIKSK